MKVIFNEQGFVSGYALIGTFGDGFDIIEVDEPENLEAFELNYRSYFLSDGKLVNNEDKQLEIENSRALKELRAQREKMCFPYINRGELWYSRLTDAQKTELGVWYQAWLDVTETKVVPSTPSWLSEV